MIFPAGIRRSKRVEHRLILGLITLTLVACGTRIAKGQAAARAAAVTDSNKQFDPHDLSGVWRLDLTQKAALLFKSVEPEPPLSDWGKQHLFEGGITHGSNPVPSGHFAGENCGPIGVPAQFAYLRFYPFENIQLSGRIHQVFELHREWRDIWLNRDHPKDLTSTYMGDSVGKWEGNTLVVDTIGYNGKDWVTEDVAHPMSNQFHLIERYTRISYNTMKVDMTFSDPKVWGDKVWGGFTRILKLQNDQLQEWMCVPEVDSEFNRKIMQPTYGSEHLNLPKDQPKK